MKQKLIITAIVMSCLKLIFCSVIMHCCSQCEWYQEAHRRLTGILFRERKANACVIVPSNALDKSTTREKDQAELTSAIKRFCTGKSEIGFWRFDRRAGKDLRNGFENAGLSPPTAETMEPVPPPSFFE